MVQKGFVNSAYRGKRRVLERNYSKTIEKFYFRCVLPEILDGRAPRNMPLREPLYVEESSRSKKQKMIDIGERLGISQGLSTSLSLPPISREDLWLDEYFECPPHAAQALYINKTFMPYPKIEYGPYGTADHKGINLNQRKDVRYFKPKGEGEPTTLISDEKKAWPTRLHMQQISDIYDMDNFTTNKEELCKFQGKFTPEDDELSPNYKASSESMLKPTHLSVSKD
ncbi:hypothetical protein TNCV_3580851 [Trichonephila clavipes]|nr:hypothetical protein TNCV_3580851 [Trichonephila clavipes]